MGQLSGITHDLQSHKNSCLQEASRVRSDIYDIERKLKELDSASAWERITHGREIKRRREVLEESLSKLKQRLNKLDLEMDMYNRYGLNPPPTAYGYEEMMKQIEEREQKLDIVSMIELGLM